MKIIVWGINYAPEVTGIAPYNTQLCEYLAARGHEVRMVTTFAYYPQWRKAASDRGRLHRKERMNGVIVHRCWHFVPHHVTVPLRILHELSFGLTAGLRALALPRAEIHIVVSPPLILGLFAWAVTRLRGSRFIFHVQDLQPDAAVGLGMVQRGPFTRLLYALEAFAYQKAARVGGISAGMIRAFAAKGVPETKRLYFPNWIGATRDAREDAGLGARARAQHGVAPEALLAVYSGNLGRKQGLQVLVDAAEQLRAGIVGSRRVVIVIAGEGAMRAELAEQISARNLDNLHLLPLLADDDYRALLAAADISLITQAPGTGQVFFPSKLLTVLAAGKPVLAVADFDSELANAVREGGFGAVTPAGDAAVLAKRLQSLANQPDVLKEWAAGTIWVQRFDATRVLGTFADEVEKLAAETAGPHNSPV